MDYGGIGALVFGAVVLLFAIRLNREVFRFLGSLTESDGSRSTPTSGRRGEMAIKRDRASTNNVGMREGAMAKNDAIIIKPGDPFYDFWANTKSSEKIAEDSVEQSATERNVSRAYEFDSRLSTNGLEDFFYWVNTPDAWEETAQALEAIGATPLVLIFRRLIRTDGGYVLRYLQDENAENFQLSQDYEQQLHDARPGKTFEEKVHYIERLLETYKQRNGLT